MNKVRAFISVDIPENMQREIVKIQESLPDFRGKFTETENLHLTLKFLGDIDEKTLSEVKKRLKEIDVHAFETKISEIGVFSPEYLRIVWLKLDGCDKLQNAIDDSLSGIFEKEARFMSHLTIVRIKKIKGKERFLNQIKKIKIPDSLKFRIDSFRLKKSTLTPKGPVYDTIEEYFLI